MLSAGGQMEEGQGASGKITTKYRTGRLERLKEEGALPVGEGGGDPSFKWWAHLKPT